MGVYGEDKVPLSFAFYAVFFEVKGFRYKHICDGVFIAEILNGFWSLTIFVENLHQGR